jgi:hypothetical protein
MAIPFKKLGSEGKSRLSPEKCQILGNFRGNSKKWPQNRENTVITPILGRHVIYFLGNCTEFCDKYGVVSEMNHVLCHFAF